MKDETEKTGRDAEQAEQILEEPRCAKIKRVTLIILFGQLLSIFIAGMGVCVTLLTQNGVNLPTAQVLPHYSLMALMFGSYRVYVYCRQKRLPSPLNPTGDIVNRTTVEKLATAKSWLLCATAGVIDVHSTWATLTAYKYTNMVSAQVLDCVGIPTTVVLSFFILKHRYKWTHYVGISVSLVGTAMMITADVLVAPVNPFQPQFTGDDAKRNVIIGDLLAITGGILYGMSSVIQEYATSNYGASTYLSRATLFSAVLSAVYCAGLEHNHLTALLFTGYLSGRKIPYEAVYYYLGYLAAMFGQDTLTAFTIKRTTAAFLNLSLLTSDVYGLGAGIWLFGTKFHYLFFIAFSIIITGVIIFSLRRPEEATKESGSQQQKQASSQKCSKALYQT
ncbi:unnamed protein product [Dicrocoelium dendriticum]|nr:unnamed protein product [Dicrocoelium dendriticum]